MSTPAPSPTLQLHLAGEPWLALPGTPPRPLERRAAALLLLVLLEPGITRARVAPLLWPDSAEPRQALRQQLLRFRQQLGRALLVGDEVLQLADGVQADLGSPVGPELLQGLRFDDCEAFEQWLQARRRQRREAALQAWGAEASAAEEQGELDTALALAQQLQQAEPDSELHARRRMRLHYLRGDAAQALQVAVELRQRLAERFGTEPSQATRDLERTLREALTPAARVAQAASAPPAAPTPAPRRDLSAPAPTALAAVEGASPGAPNDALRTALQRPPRRVGRDAELQHLAAAWQARTAAVLVGEGGIGKTRLLDDLARQQGGAWLRARARPGDRNLPYALLVRLARSALQALAAPLPPALAQELARLLPELGEPARERRAADQVRLFDAVRALLARTAAAGTQALLLDDLHHADTASLEALRHAAAEPNGLAWIVALRPTDGHAALAAFIDTLRSQPGAEPLVLAPLAEADVEELLLSLAAALPAAAALQGTALVPQLRQRTGGNPLFLLETLKALLLQRGAGADTPLPALSAMPGVAELVTQRLTRLSPRALALVRAAAVAGQDFSAELAVAVLQERAVDLADAWAELERAQLFAGNGFAHDLLHEAAELTLPQPVAAAMHTLVADWLARQTEPRPPPPARVAHHHERAGHPERAAPHWQAAGEQALATLRFAEAADAFERAALGHGGAGRSSAAFGAALAMRQASFEIDLGRRSASAIALLERYATTPAQRAKAANERAVTLLHQGDIAATEAAALAGLQALAGADEPLLRAELRRNLAGVALWRQQTALALAELRAIEADVERLGSLHLKAEFHQSLAMVLDHADEVVAAQAAHERAFALYLEVQLVPAAAQVALNLAASHHDCGDLTAAWAALERAATLLAGLPDSQRSYSSLHLNSGYVLGGLGRYAQALENLDRAVDNARVQTPGWLPLVLANRALVWLHLGQLARAQQDLAETPPQPGTPLVARARWATVQSRLTLQLHGRQAEALRPLEALLAELPPQGRRLTRWRLQLARLAHLADEPAVAAAEALAQELQGLGRRGLEIVVAGERAERLHRLGRVEDAAAQARQALATMAQHRPDSSYPGQLWLQCLPPLREADPALYRRTLAAALQWLDDTAASAVPPLAREGFVGRHAVNLGLRAQQRLA